ncbi:MAG: sugar phosphate isomerase/epimerase [Verrucomicrobia bacterium]|nr:sugar phosphate isomerase/epimerase [Verrucomicrobiota bacterium]
MTPAPRSRRAFLGQALAAAGATALLPPPLRAAPAPDWTIGCLNRPWTKWSCDAMLDGVKAAGFTEVGLQTPTKDDPFVAATSAEYLAELARKIATRGLRATMGRLRTRDDGPFEAAQAEVRRQLANARTLGLGTLINTGVGKPAQHETWYRAMAYAAAHGAELGVRIVTKPHGGVTAAATDLVRCVERVNHPNFGIWYDPGNIIHYTGLDPVAELEPLLPYVRAFTAKDCAAKGGEVMIQLGAGAVDFAALFRRLRRAGFTGPVMLEGGAVGETAEATTRNARANREFLARAFTAA